MGKKQIRKFQNLIFDWWEVNKRDLPWRHTRDPYKILVSEIMLQQTRVAAVLEHYRIFLERFPNIIALAEASEDDGLVRAAAAGDRGAGRAAPRASARAASP